MRTAGGRRAGVPAAGLVMAVALAAGGCSGGTGEADPVPSGTSKSPSRWRAGEFTGQVDLCAAITREGLRPLLMERAGKDGFGCSWRLREEGVDADRVLTLTSRRYEPSPARPGKSATDEARHEFLRPPGWRFGAGAPVRDLGDEAKIGHVLRPGDWRHRVAVAVRVRNVLFQIEVLASTHRAGDRDRVPPLGDLEAGVLALARGVLVRLGGPGTPAPSAPLVYGPGETDRPRGLCGPIGAAAGRLLPGAKAKDLTPETSRLATGCLWERPDGNVSDHLLVNAEVIPPSPATGRRATEVAVAAFGGWPRGGALRRRTGPGDDAVVSRFESGRLHHVYVMVRRGNLLVYAGLERWDAGASTKTMEDEVVRVAEAVLARHA